MVNGSTGKVDELGSKGKPILASLLFVTQNSCTRNISGTLAGSCPEREGEQAEEKKIGEGED